MAGNPRFHSNAVLFKPIYDFSIHAVQRLCKLKRQDFGWVVKRIALDDFESD
jgi:hypothetical protein